MGDGGIDKPARAALLKAMLTDMLIALQACEAVERTILVTGEGRAERLAMELIRQSPRKTRRPLEVMQEPEDMGHSGAATLGIVRALSLGAEAALLLPGDCPLAGAEDFAAVCARLWEPGDGDGEAPGRIVVVPDRVGSGTNALAMRPADGINPAFGADSRAIHLRRAGDRGFDAAVLENARLAHDCDTPADLADLREVLAADQALAPKTAVALEGIPAA